MISALIKDLLFGKFLVVVVGYIFFGFNWVLDPNTLVTLPEEADPINESNVKAAGFTLIAAVALFAGVFPRARTPIDNGVEFFARILGVISAAGAGWFWLDAETSGNPGTYVIPILSFTFLAIYTVIGGAAFFVVVFRAMRVVGAVVLAVINAIWLCLTTFSGFLRRIIKDAFNGVKRLFH